VINALLFPSMPYDTAKHIAPISILAAQPSVWCNQRLAAQDVAGVLLALFRQEPDKIPYGSIGRARCRTWPMASLAISARPTWRICRFGLTGRRHGAAARRCAGAVLPAGSVAELGNAGKLKMLAVTSARRSPLLPDSCRP
jgi:tripartite-type tricarboxylate transporter receptor subunit TctC